jgi:hypothetical protein
MIDWLAGEGSSYRRSRMSMTRESLGVRWPGRPGFE